MNNNNSDPVCFALSLCRKAGKIELGFSLTEQAVKKRIVKLVVISSDAAPRTVKNTAMLCEQYNVPMLTIEKTMQQIEMAIGRKFAVAAILDENFAKLIETKAIGGR